MERNRRLHNVVMCMSKSCNKTRNIKDLILFVHHTRTRKVRFTFNLASLGLEHK
jgi:hypothetical protein